MRPSIFSFIGLLLSLPLLSVAQHVEPPAYRFYGGLGMYTSEYNQFDPVQSPYSVVPVQATLGYQLRPRLAVQAAFAYSGYGDSYIDPRINTYTGQTYSAVDYTFRNTSWSLLTRYNLTRRPTQRVQFEIVGGLSLERNVYRRTGFYTDYQNNTIIYPYDAHYTENTFILVAGPSLRYQFGSRVHLVYDLLLNQSISTNHQYSHQSTTAAMTLGLRYRFGTS